MPKYNNNLLLAFCLFIFNNDQFNRRIICFQQSDIYSLGIVLMELLRPFKTEMERYKSIDALRNGNYLSKTLRNQWPHLVTNLIASRNS